MSSKTRSLPLPRLETSETKWARRRDIPIAILAWITVAAVILWVAGHIIRALLLLAIAALLAYALAPLVKLLQRVMPRLLAILIVYVIVLSGISFLFYQIVGTAIRETVALSQYVRGLLQAGANGQPTSLDETLMSFGITSGQIAAVREQIVTAAETVARNSFPYLRSIFDLILDTVVVAVLSIYLLIDGSRAAHWLRHNAPLPARADFLINTIQRIVGGYIRGQFSLAVLIGVLVGLGMQFLFHLPYAIFLGVFAFIMAFIPVLGTLISGTLCVLIGLTQGWPVALGVLIYFIVAHVIESDLVGPRIVGQAIGLHPVVSLFALVAGAELFGIWGALFASPLAGVLQALLIALWSEWREAHPQYFEQAEEEVTEEVVVQKIEGGSPGSSKDNSLQKP
jgi:predicted PurR-regulated permease PerM